MWATLVSFCDLKNCKKEELQKETVLEELLLKACPMYYASYAAPDVPNLLSLDGVPCSSDVNRDFWLLHADHSASWKHYGGDH
jgi:hypothetical protein